MVAPPSARRFVIAMALGAVSGLLCAVLAGQHQPELSSPTHPIFWAIVTDRFLIGVVVALAGVYTTQPVMGFPYPPLVRGSCLGAAVSVPLAAGALHGPTPPEISPWMVFWATLVAGAFYGAVIDWVATRFGGQGRSLLGP